MDAHVLQTVCLNFLIKISTLFAEKWFFKMSKKSDNGHPPTQFHWNPSSSKQTNPQSPGWKHDLLGGGNKAFSAQKPSTQVQLQPVSHFWGFKKVQMCWNDFCKAVSLSGTSAQSSFYRIILKIDVNLRIFRGVRTRLLKLLVWRQAGTMATVKSLEMCK